MSKGKSKPMVIELLSLVPTRDLLVMSASVSLMWEGVLNVISSSEGGYL